MITVLDRLAGSWVWVAVTQAITQLRTYGKRSLLTSLGIIIAVAGVIAIVGVMQGLQESVQKTLADLGSETLFIRPNNYKAWGLSQKLKPLTQKELHALNSNVSGISNVVMLARLTPPEGAELRYKSKRISLSGLDTFSIRATTAFLPELIHRFPIQGRFIAESDDAARRRVCVINAAVKKSLGLPDNLIGEIIEIAGHPHTIIGLMPSLKTDSLGVSAAIYVPFSAGEYLGTAGRPDMIFRIKQDTDRANITLKIENLLRQSMQSSRSDAEDFLIEDVAEISAANTGIINAITSVLLLVVSISLIVGGIGIMNVMLASVTERTHEIGILRAIGATAWHIRMQFLIEAGLLAIFGAIVGVVLGIGLAQLTVLFLDKIEHISVPLWSIVVSILVASLVGIISGYAPAARAARIDPIQALTHL